MSLALIWTRSNLCSSRSERGRGRRTRSWELYDLRLLLFEKLYILLKIIIIKLFFIDFFLKNEFKIKNQIQIKSWKVDLKKTIFKIQCPKINKEFLTRNVSKLMCDIKTYKKLISVLKSLRSY